MESITLFPLNTLLFPGVPLPLKVFEPRYLDMISNCLKRDRGFGVVKIRAGDEVIASSQWRPPEVFPLGVYVEVIDWNRSEDGLLAVLVQGEKKFRVQDTTVSADKLLWAEIEFLPEEPVESLGDDYNGLTDLLGALREHPAVAGLRLPEVSDTRHLGWQLTQLLPLSTPDKLALLELNDPALRLDRLAARVAELSHH